MGDYAEHELHDARAPDDLDLVRLFVNTRNHEGDEDMIASPEGLRAWLRERDLVAEADPVTEADVARLRELRESLRAVMLANHDRDEVPAGAAAALDTICVGSRLCVGFDDAGRPTLRPGGDGVDHFIGRMLAAIVRAEVTGDWERMKACRADTCRWAFYDESKNHSRSWCSMEICGNREKARRYRERHKAGT